MIAFERFHLRDKETYDRFLLRHGCKGCEYNFANLYMWGRQNAAVVGQNLAFFSEFSGKSLYLFPIGDGDILETLELLMADARERSIAFRLTGLSASDRELLERAYPGKFHFHISRSSFDYVYAIDDLADLKGRKFQKKRNHVNRFRQEHPDHKILPLSEETLPLFRAMFETWYQTHSDKDPHSDLYMEQVAVKKALEHWHALEMEGLVLTDGGTPLAVTMGTRLCADTFDVHFEKARDGEDGAYAVINQEFARHLRQKFPDIRYLNREDDLGIEGLRKAKLSYCPEVLVEKAWAVLREEGYDY